VDDRLALGLGRLPDAPAHDGQLGQQPDVDLGGVEALDSQPAARPQLEEDAPDALDVGVVPRHRHSLPFACHLPFFGWHLRRTARQITPFGPFGRRIR
jgi:hypothetical protein